VRQTACFPLFKPQSSLRMRGGDGGMKSSVWNTASSMLSCATAAN
jgi:hypothetical protein